jgi:hypothetical protein
MIGARSAKFHADRRAWFSRRASASGRRDAAALTQTLAFPVRPN